MTIQRRQLLALVAAGCAARLVRAQTPGATAVQTAAWETERAVGSPQAKNRVEEWFSLTCTHCAGSRRILSRRSART